MLQDAPHRPSLLVVDDERPIRRALWRILRDEYEIVEAAGSREAIHHILENEVDVVISDINRPGMSGLDMLDEMKRLRPEVEVIILTASPSVERIVRAVRSGAFDFLTKPWDRTRIRDVLRAAVEHRRYP